MATRKDDNQKTHIESDATPQLDEIGIAYHQSPDIVADARTIIDSAQAAARCAVNVTLVVRNWLLGRRIAEEELHGKGRAGYGKQVVDNLSKNSYRPMARAFPEGPCTSIFSSTRPSPRLCTHCVHNLIWL